MTHFSRREQAKFVRQVFLFLKLGVLGFSMMIFLLVVLLTALFLFQRFI